MTKREKRIAKIRKWMNDHRWMQLSPERRKEYTDELENEPCVNS